jgi:hypothetical protein
MRDFPWRLRVWMLLLNFFPCAHVLFTLWLLLFWPVSPGLRGGAALASIYLLPPLLTQMVRLAVSIPEGFVPLDTAAFLAWWATAQFQALFNRFPILEEAIRIFPGAYSTWLRLWGSRIGRLTFWAPGAAVLDRSYLDIGDDVVFGAGVRLNGHVLLKNSEGRLELALGKIRIGRGAMVGGYSLLTAGSEIPEGESTRAFLVSPPFTRWDQGKRVKAPIGGHV